MSIAYTVWKKNAFEIGIIFVYIELVFEKTFYFETCENFEKVNFESS